QKVLFTPLEVTALYSRRKGVLARAFSLVPEYLRTYDPDEVVNPMDFSLQLGRNFRALKVWWVIRAFGLNGLRARMEHQLDLAAWLREQIDADPDFETLDAMTAAARTAATPEEEGPAAPSFTPYPLVCFRAFPRGSAEAVAAPGAGVVRSEEHTSELQSRENLVCRLLLEKKNKKQSKALR